MSSALICIDFINDIVDPKGKLAGKGYADFVLAKETLSHVQDAQAAFRSTGAPVIHVRVGFSRGYADHPEGSPLFGGAEGAGALLLGAWGTEFVQQVAPIDGDISLTKPRVSAFYGTRLASILSASEVRTIFICGVATDLAVEAAARDAHDRDFEVVVLADCCAAADDEDHERSLSTLRKIARVESAQNSPLLDAVLGKDAT